MKTFMQKPAAVQRTWHLIDAKDRVLGQVATEVAKKLMGKEKTTFTPHIDGGDFVIVVNASQIRVTGNKGMTKQYHHHSLFPGGLTTATFDELLKSNPTRIVQEAVNNMLPKNRLRKGRMNRLKVFADANHKHEAEVGGNK
jgi:large subunit ribosomal protein L13